MARPTDWSEEIEVTAWKYVNGGWKEEGHSIPSVVGLCNILGRSRECIYNWGRDGNKGFSDILRSCNENQELTLINGGLNNSLNAGISKLVLGKHGYSDKQDNTLSSPDGGPVKTSSVFEFVPVGNNEQD